MFKYLSIIALISLLSLEALAIDQIQAKVTKAGIRGDGSLFVEFDKTINEPGCAAPKFEAAKDHPQIDRLLSIALSAAASGVLVNVRTNGCVRNAPGFDNSQASFFYFGERN